MTDSPAASAHRVARSRDAHAAAAGQDPGPPGEQGLRLAQKMQAGPYIPVDIQLQKAGAGLCSPYPSIKCRGERRPIASPGPRALPGAGEHELYAELAGRRRAGKPGGRDIQAPFFLYSSSGILRTKYQP
jgi:hypothetical protein